jgi:hypothetical protein
MKRILSLMLIGILLLSGCEGAASELAGLDQAKIAEMLGTAQEGASSTGEELLKGSTQTMTPFIPVVGVNYQTPTTNGAVAGDESITITHIDGLETGKAMLYWDATGDFPSGFKVVWAKNNNAPVFPDDIWDYISDGSARSAEVFGNAEESYYFRVCKYLNGACTFYSPVVEYTFEKVNETTEKSATPTPNSSATIKITSIQSAGNGKANIYWDASGSFPKGFKVVWSENTSEPVYPGNSYVYLSSPSARSTTVEGTAGKKVTFRVCRYDGSKCDVYSNSYTFTFSGTSATATATSSSKSITITGISNVSSGKATVAWNASGSFPNGFKVVWSDSTSSPVYPGNDYVYMSDGSTRSAQVTGTAGKKYYFRVCEYLGGSCGVYSNSYEFTYSGTSASATPDTSSISITSVTAPEFGKAVVTWSASGSFPSGFKVVWSASTTTPVYPGNDYVYLSDGSARSATITGTPGQTIYIRVGKYTGSGCSTYSNTYTFTFTSAAAPTATTEVPPTATTEVPPTATIEVPPSETPVPIETPVTVEAPVGGEDGG